MAGEFPDRSKQRESSAEPTSGSTGPVPEARDPRLAVARDTEPSPAPRGGVDTATRVISARDVARARAAASAEEAGADSDAENSTGGAAAAEAEGSGSSSASDSGATSASGSVAEGSARGADATEDDVEAKAEGSGAGSRAGAAEGAGNADRAERAAGAGHADDGDRAEDAGAEDGAGHAEDASRSEGTGAEDGVARSEDAGAAEGAGRADGAERSEDAGAADGAGHAEDAARSENAGAEVGARRAEDARRSEDAGTAAGSGSDDAGRPERAAAGTHAPGTGDAGSETDAEPSTSAQEAEAPENGSAEDADAETPVHGPAKDAEARDAEPVTGAVPDAETSGASPAGSAQDAGTDTGVDGETPEAGSRAAALAAGGAKTGGPDDSRLRAAVAAWVRTGDSTDEDGSGAGETAPEDAEPSGSAAKADTEAPEASEAPEAGDPVDSAEKAGAKPVADAEPVRDAVPAQDAVPTGADEPGAADGKADAKAADRTGNAGQANVPAWAADRTGDARQAADGQTDAPARPGDRTGNTPQAADAPPTPTDPSRTGGAHGNAKADPEPPRVDQPTTMLKLPSAAERTSKFVALKPDVTTPVPQIGPERTTQQPLPPKPPLDLLAELTNTPPPPETPLRTTVRRVKIWTPLVLLLAIVFAIVQAVRPLPSPSLELTAKDTYTFDGGKADIPWPAQGQAALEVQGIGSFGSSGDQKPVPIASVAKVMTAYLILRDHPLKGDAKGPMIKVDQAAEDQASAEGESTVKVKAGDEISEREALQGILLASANNVARLVARWDAGSEKGFVAKMNAAAKDLGMTNTTYTDPSGLNDTTVSTAVDQVKLAKAAMKDPVFREVAAMPEYIDYKGAKQYNWNKLVGRNNVIGIKTGTTTSARGNLVFAATKEIGGETRTVVGAVLRQPEGGFDNTILQGALSAGDKLIRAAQANLEAATILKKGDVVGYVDDGLGGKTPVVAAKDVPAVGWAGLTVKVSFAADGVPHTAKAGAKVGTLTVGDASTGAVQVPVALQKDLVEPGFTDKLTRIG
ncbi:D-alanyl-D-alanine carboxypeptidase [Streptomyces sp. S.PB5]|uniref:D-alanyl-D-alanine carboxypeptidase n=1 Tax=Streptomyces sp. S.PB5 TaxID=3020844 RepID=UPI0025B1E0A8|nr:D-alanyl-D-alanine carboxypeptidase [Streptomyces sp. S.PB5]MDN3023248.1 D-alanyl-D-alanine carboxypeptidase [Streptomyces sp. S.PB5]